MMILKDKYEYYLCDDQNFFFLEPFYSGRVTDYDWFNGIHNIDFRENYDTIAGYELGEYEYLFEEVKFFEYKQGYITGTIIMPTKHFVDNFKAFVRDIKINDILA